MALATVSSASEQRARPRARQRRPWRISLTRRILAVNIFALALFAGGFFYLDSFRTRIIDERLDRMRREDILMASALEAAPDAARAAVIARLARLSGYHLRLYGAGGTLDADSVTLGAPSPPLVDPASEPLSIRLARMLDQAVDTVVFAHIPEPFATPMPDRASAWPEVMEARRRQASAWRNRFAPDRTPMLSVAVPVGLDGEVLLATQNARDITVAVRAERLRLGLVLAVAVLVSVLLSLFLARTIVLPLRRLARAAGRVRLGRAREVVVPRLPDRRDEIGLLARALSDMTQALRKRIDATDHFAADVSHELKNPIASLRSALEGLGRIEDPALRRRLVRIAEDDVHRLDRLVTDIAEASRIDAQLSRAPFRPIDLAGLVARLVRAHEMRGLERGVRLRFTGPGLPMPPVLGEEQRLARVFENLIDNAVSFSPDRGTIRLALIERDGAAVLSIEDEGPGIAADQREAVFRRFHSVRPDSEDFGKHSGLGLAIAQSILEGHNGEIRIEDRPDGQSGARFVIRLPLAEDAL